MKRLLISVVALFMIFSVQASAQARLGVIAGMNFNTSKFTDISVKSKAGWNAGLSCLVDLPLGFSVQPSLVYSQKSASITSEISQNMGFVELPLSVQWGPDLLVLRPFIDVTPYIGYAVSNRTRISNEIIDAKIKGKNWEGKERFEYGLGLGGGLNVWKFQIIARYCWNFGSLYNNSTWDDIKGHLKDDLNVESKNFGGVTLSLAFFF